MIKPHVRNDFKEPEQVIRLALPPYRNMQQHIYESTCILSTLWVIQPRWVKIEKLQIARNWTTSAMLSYRIGSEQHP